MLIMKLIEDKNKDEKITVLNTISISGIKNIKNHLLFMSSIYFNN